MVPLSRRHIAWGLYSLDNLEKIVDLLLDLADSNAAYGWHAIKAKSTEASFSNLQQALVVRWDMNHRGRLLVSNTRKDPERNESESKATLLSKTITLEAIRQCLKATEPMLRSRRLHLQGRKEGTNEDHFAREKIRNSLDILAALNLREDTEKRKPAATRSNDGFMSFWIHFPADSHGKKKECLNFIKARCDDHKGKRRIKERDDSSRLESLDQWVYEHLKKWKATFFSNYKRCQLVYVPLNLEISPPETLPDNTLSDCTSPDLSTLIESTLSTTSPSMILVEGEAGSGKTNLLFHIARFVMEQNCLPILLEPPDDSTQDIVEVVRKQLKFVYPDVDADRVQALLQARLLIIFIDQYSQLTVAQKNWCKKQLHPDHLNIFVLSSRLDPSSDFRHWPTHTIMLPRLPSEGYTDFFSQFLNSITPDKPHADAERHASRLSNRLKLIAPKETTVRFAFLALSLYTFTNIGTEHPDEPIHLASKILPNIHSWENLADEYLICALSPLPQRHESSLSDYLRRIKLLAITVFEQADQYCSQPFKKDIFESAFNDMNIFNEEIEKILINSSLICPKPGSNHYEFSFSSLAILLASLGLIQRIQKTQDSFSEFRRYLNDLTAQTRTAQVNSSFLESLRSCLISLKEEDARWLDIIKILDNYRSTHGSILQDLGTLGEIRNNLENYKKYRKFIGRESYLDKLIKSLCVQPDRIVKIKGVGGAGKTALAVEAALRICKEYPIKFNVIYCQSAKIENRGWIGKHVNDPGYKFTSLDTLIRGLLSFCYSDYNVRTPEESKDKLKEYLTSTNNSTLIRDP